MRIAIVACTALATFALVAPASAHVTVNPREAEADSFARFAVRVPNERPDAATTAVSMQIPEGIDSVSFQPVPGWERAVETEPVAAAEGDVAEEAGGHGDVDGERVATVTWSGGPIAPGEFQEFGISVRVPDAAGEELAFPSTQTYDSGEVVRWIGAADSDLPAGRVALTAPAEPVVSEQAVVAEAPPVAPAVAEGDSGRANLALGIGIGALVVALGALALSALRRRGAA